MNPLYFSISAQPKQLCDARYAHMNMSIFNPSVSAQPKLLCGERYAHMNPLYFSISAQPKQLCGARYAHMNMSSSFVFAAGGCEVNYG